MEIIKKTLLLFLASAAILVPIKLNAQKTDAKPIVYFVHGLQFEIIIINEGRTPESLKCTPKEKVIEKLEKIFPNHTIKYYEWSSYFHKRYVINGVLKRDDGSNEDFGKYYWRAYYDKPKDLADELFSMPHEQLERVILVGHSLGGVIVVKTMEKLAKKGFKIDRGIFLGTALECDEDGCNSITTAIQASKHFNINIYNVDDEALVEDFYLWCLWKNAKKGENPVQTKKAFGAHGYKKNCPKHWLMQIEDTTHKKATIFNPHDNHDVMNYLEDLDEFFRDYRKIFSEK